MIQALPARYAQPDPLDPEAMKAWDADFADAMRDAFAAHPESHEVRTVFAEALLNLTPWKMWDLPSGQPAARARTVEAQTVLEEALEGDPSAMQQSRILHNNTVVDLLAIGSEMLRGEILYRQSKYDDAFGAVRRAISLEDTLPYDEPWGWMQPVRHALGALLLEQGHTDEAEVVFREDLGLGGQLARATVHPDNVWALKGLHDCLEARGETVEIVQVRQRLDLAQARADRAIAASCFCAQAAMRAAD